MKENHHASRRGFNLSAVCGDAWPLVRGMLTASFVLQAVGQLGDANEVLNERAVAVMTRMSNKLTGRDFMVNGNAGAPPGLPGPPPTAVAASSYLLAATGIGAPGAEREEPGLTVKVQVQKLIAQAMSHENLCQSYIG